MNCDFLFGQITAAGLTEPGGVGKLNIALPALFHFEESSQRGLSAKSAAINLGVVSLSR